MTVVLDSGIYISAMEFGGVPKDALALAFTSGTVLICSQMEEEIVGTMCRKFGHPAPFIKAEFTKLTRNAVHIEISAFSPRICRDPKDDYLLECALVGNAALLVTGDRDLLSLRNYGSVAIITPRQYVDREGR